MNSVTLSDGTVVTTNEDATVGDMYQAELACQIKYKDEKGQWQEKTDQVKLKYAMMSSLLLFNGSPRHVDDVLKLKFKDFMAISPMIEESMKTFTGAQTA